jgi:hypothetical protein
MPPIAVFGISAPPAGSWRNEITPISGAHGRRPTILFCGAGAGILGRDRPAPPSAVHDSRTTNPARPPARLPVRNPDGPSWAIRSPDPEILDRILGADLLLPFRIQTPAMAGIANEQS